MKSDLHFLAADVMSEEGFWPVSREQRRMQRTDNSYKRKTFFLIRFEKKLD